MADLLNQYVAIQTEAAYGTRVAAGVPRGYESTTDGFSRDVIFVEGGGRHVGRVGMQSNRRRLVDRGATGRIESPMLTRGEGLRLQHVLGGSTAPAAVSGQTGAFQALFSADVTGPDGSYTADVARVDASNTMRYFQYLGCVPTGFSVSVEEGGDLMLGIDYDCQGESVLAAAPTAPTYPDAATTEMFIFEDCSLSVAGASVSGFKSFSMDVDLGMDIARYFIQGSADKKQPVRGSEPSFSGTMSGEFLDLAEYNRFIAGDPIAVVLTATGPAVIGSSTQMPVFRITLPAVQYNGSTPESSLDSLSMIDVPFMALSSSADSICEMEYISADSAF